MKAKILLSLICNILSFSSFGATYIISPSGSDANTGSINSPFATIQFAVNKALPGDLIYLRGGTFKITSQINITTANNGTKSAPVKLWAYSNEKPLLDFSGQTIIPSGGVSLSRGFLITGDFWHLKGFEIYATADNGIKLEGNYNVIEQLVIHHCGDSGIQLGFGHTTNQNNPGNLCAYNKIINCDSYRNYDYDNYGSDADGFACKMHNGKGNIFFGCRAWENADDAWDLFETDWPVQIYYCWAWRSGDKTLFLPWHAQRTGKTVTSFQGNGNGIKLGGDGAGGQSKGTHIVGRCVAFNNTKTTSVKGFDQNSHKGGLILYHNLAWNNGYNFMFETAASPGNSNLFINNVSIKGAKNDYEIVPGSTETNNSWNLTGVLASAADYVTLTEEAAKAPRQGDGTLPDNGFARLVTGSDLINKGKKIDSLAFSGSAPDLGPYEYGITTGFEDLVPEDNQAILYPNPYENSFDILLSGFFSYTITDLQGFVAEQGSGMDQVSAGQSLNPGIYMVQYTSDTIRKSIKIVKVN